MDVKIEIKQILQMLKVFPKVRKSRAQTPGVSPVSHAAGQTGRLGGESHSWNKGKHRKHKYRSRISVWRRDCAAVVGARSESC